MRRNGYLGVAIMMAGTLLISTPCVAYATSLETESQAASKKKTGSRAGSQEEIGSQAGSGKGTESQTDSQAENGESDSLSDQKGSQDGQPSEKPDSEMGGQPPERPDGEMGEQPPEKPDGEMGEQPPEKPDGEMGEQPPERPDGEMGEQPPERPDGESGEQPPERPDGEMGEQPPQKPDGEMGGQPPQGMPGGGEQERADLSAAFTVDGEETTADGETHASTSADENAVLVKNGGSLTLRDATVTKSGDSTNVDQSNFYARNAAIAVQEGSSCTLENVTVTTDAEGSNAIFATGEDAVITVENVSIHTTGNSSRGLDATYGGTVIAKNVDITTEGAHCAPLATDRGEGTITVEEGTLSAKGDGSPCIYSTGAITAIGVTGMAMDSQTLVVEGKNSVSLENCDLMGAGKNGLMLYQSTSGDAGEGTATLTSVGSKLTTTSGGPMIYVTNTAAKASFTDTSLHFRSGILAQVSGNNTNNWGKEGENGGDFTLEGIAQAFAGDITCDEISAVTLTLQNESSWDGAMDTAGTGSHTAVSLDATSTWNVTADSHVSVLENALSDNSNITSNGYTIYYDADQEANAWLGGETIQLADGGQITPEK